jgi:phosphoribosylanthranilate isomerase
MTLPERLGVESFEGAVQIAGVLDVEEARMLVDCDVDFLGIPLDVPIHDEGVTEAVAKTIASEPACQGRVVLITYLEHANRVADLCERVGASIVQLHGDIPYDEVVKLRASAPELRIIRALVVGYSNLRIVTTSLTDVVDAFITDTFDEKTGAHGATGMTHDWRVSHGVVKESPVPVILAGGLNPQNVARAIMEVEPAGVDAHTGVEDSTGRKDRELVRAFVSEARSAFARLRDRSK